MSPFHTNAKTTSHHALKPFILLLVVQICSVITLRIISKHITKEIVDRAPKASSPLTAPSLAPGRDVVDAVANNRDKGRENGEESPLSPAEWVRSEEKVVKDPVGSFEESGVA